MLNVPPVDAAYARMRTSWEVTDDSGYSIPGGTLIGYALGNNTFAFFRTLSTATVPAGFSQVYINVESVQPGEAYNNLPIGPLQLMDALTFVKSVTSTTLPVGGEDAETDAEYLNRLQARLKLLAPRPIVPQDFATLALDVPGVDRAFAIDGYSPANGRMDNERTISVAVVDPAGNPVGTVVRNAVTALLESQREANFVVYAINPSITTVDVTATLKAFPGFDVEAVRADAAAAVRSYLSPASWDWDVVVRYNELVQLLSNVPGVDYVDALVNPTDNIFLEGVAALVQAGTVNITVEQG
nr:baseplate J/gp47 family protein [Kineococcus vitellinus]